MDDAKKVAVAPRRLERPSVLRAPPEAPKDLAWCSLHAPFVPLTCASEARLRAARRDACLAGSVSPPLRPALVRVSPLALPGAEEAEASAVRHAPAGRARSFDRCRSRRLLPKVQAGPARDPKVTLRCLFQGPKIFRGRWTSRLRRARRSEDLLPRRARRSEDIQAPKSSKIRRPPRSEELEDPKTQKIRRTPKPPNLF